MIVAWPNGSEVTLPISENQSAAPAPRAKILSAARKALTQKGYSSAYMNDLTAKVGLIAVRSIKTWDTRGLLRAVLEEVETKVQARDWLAAGGSSHGLVAARAAYIKMALQPEIRRIALRDDPLPSETYRNG